MIMRALEVAPPEPIERLPLKLVERPLPMPAPGQIRVRVAVCALCRTDLHVIEGDLVPARSPIVPGHQVVGRVEARGDGAGRFQLGDRVGIAWLRHTCGACEHCRRGDENLCPFSRYTGYHEDGGYADYALVDEAFAYALPAALDDEAAAPLLCAGIIGWRALARAEVAAGARLGLYGFGSSAHLVLQLARHRGCDVYVATRGERHRRLASELGAVWVGPAEAPPPRPLDAAILFAPAGELVPPMLRALRPGGSAVIAGIHLTPVPVLTYEPHLFHEKRLTSVEANTRRDGEALLAEAAQAGIAARRVRFAFADANQALAALKHDGLEGTGILVVDEG